MGQVEKYQGIIPAFYACYDKDGKVSEQRTRALARHFVRKGVKGLYVCGSSGECIYLKVKERKKILETVMDEVGAYYESGLNPVKIWIEDEYVRAVKGGIGEAKTGGNYVASLASQVKAHDEGYAQVLWLDGVERKYIEEVGAMNIFFKINGTVVTPQLNGSILPGVTRDSALYLCRQWGIPVEERRISVDEVIKSAESGEMEECFGTGTAAVVSPVGELRFEQEKMPIGENRIGELTQRIYDTITGIQLGRIEGPKGWSVEVK